MQIVEKHKLALRWFHWLNFPVLGLMIWSGLLIYWANDVYGIWWNGKELFHFFPTPFYEKLNVAGKLAPGLAWHFTVMWLFMLNGIIYVVWSIASGHYKELMPDRNSFREAIQVVLYDLRLTKVHPPEAKFNAAQKFSYLGVVAMGAGSTLTGLAIYKPVQLHWLTALVGGYEIARGIHFILTLLYVLFFIVHVGQVIKTGWNNFRSMLTGYEIVKSNTEAEHA